MGVVVERIPEAVAADDDPGMQNAPFTHNTSCIEHHMRVQDRISADETTAAHDGMGV
jgi:hypothetical protein